MLAAIFFEAPHPVRPSSLAETFGTTRGNVSHYVSSLEVKGLLLRKIDPDDRLAYRLTLKPQGKRWPFELSVLSTGYSLLSNAMRESKPWPRQGKPSPLDFHGPPAFRTRWP